MMILACDTSLPVLSVGLLSDRTLVGSIALQGKDSRNEKLLPAIDWLLAESRIDKAAIDLLAVTRGPGSFTGVRIALATMQGLALALDRPLCAMSTHEAVALGEGTGPGSLPHLERIAVVDDAGRGEFYASSFEGHREQMAPRLVTATEKAVLIGSVALAVDLGDFVQHGNVAVACARRARALADENRLDDYGDATPIYVRLAEAEIKLQQKAP